MTQQEAQELAEQKWGKDAIAKVVEFSDHSSCFVSRSKYGLATPYGFGQTFEEAFYESQFGYTNCALHDASEDHPQYHCNIGGDRTNYAKWPAEWNMRAELDKEAA